LATDDGVYTSVNNGTNWQQAGLKGILVNSLNFNSYDTTFYAGTEKGIYLSKYNGLSWALYAFPNQGVSLVYSSGVGLYAGMTTGGLNYYADYRKIWATADTGITSNIIVKSFTENTSYQMFPGLGFYLGNNAAVTNHGVFVEKSTGNWVQANNGLASDTIVNSMSSSSDLQFQGFTTMYNNLFLGTGKDPGNVYSLHNSVTGYYWSALSTGIQGSVNALAQYRNIVFAGGSDLRVLKSDLKYLYTSKSLISWVPATGDSTTFKLFTNDFWWISTSQYDWLTFSPNTGTGDAIITVIAAPNNTKDIRFGFIFINAQEATLSFYQEAANTTGIDNPIQANITIYPVPVTDELVISVPNQPNNVRYSIYNLSGMELLAAQLTGSVTKVNMSGFKPGVYVFKIYSGNTCVTRKIIKQ
jgi:hypothetical protein